MMHSYRHGHPQTGGIGALTVHKSTIISLGRVVTE